MALLLVGLAVTPARAETARQIDWHPCDAVSGAECGDLVLPVDWSRPRGETFVLPVARRIATDREHRIGSLVFGPGGPGDSGVQRIIDHNRFSTELFARFDVVSFDPRGVGACDTSAVGARPPVIMESPAAFAQMKGYNARLRDACRDVPVYRHADTASAARDLDALRAALGDRQLTFHGSSYGSLLAQRYAELFPGRVRAIVAESVVDHDLDTRGFVRTQAANGQQIFDRWVTWCDTTVSCALHGQDVRAVWHSLPAGFDRDVRAFRAFYQGDFAGLATTVAALARGETVPPPALPPMATQVFCADWSLPVRSWAAYDGLLREARRIAPDLLPVAAVLGIASCLGAPVPVRNPQHPVSVHGLDRPMLLINARYDPASAYAWATRVAGQLGAEGVLVTYAGVQHGTYSRPCVGALVDRYLVDLAVPARGTSCPE
ncbi:alpha/beta fold hydrolase [Catenuloplanes japonicus]|uniref:alpha/beta fold hydrolase n=1 Tax=Catenuloplanes japonicus TaxID=33876 RepID=UPI001E43A890|nr:alpha/beta fold hydrolase [Catenuloplanes japonicus]